MSTHALKYNGTPYDDQGNPINEDVKSTSGVGRAMCACGALSEPLETGAARRDWFKQHRVSYTEPLPFTQAVAPGFWRSLGRDAVQALVDMAFPGVRLEPNNNSMTLYFIGPEEEVKQAIDAAEHLWEEALPASKQWKKTDPTFTGRSADRLERRKQGYHLTEDFYRSFGKWFATELVEHRSA